MVMDERTFFGNLSAHIFELSLHVVFSPFLQREIPNCQTMHRRKTKDEHLKVDEQFIVFCSQYIVPSWEDFHISWSRWV
jgi:hypothetical protein